MKISGRTGQVERQLKLKKMKKEKNKNLSTKRYSNLKKVSQL